MNDDDKIRLEQAINDKWQPFIDGNISQFETTKCPLCIEYLKNDCEGCPIKNFTGKSNCKGTPLEYFVASIESHNHSGVRDAYNCETCKSHIQNFINFLKSILPDD